MYFREKVEEIILNRLLIHTPNEIEISNIEFQDLLTRLNDKLNYYSRHYYIKGFTNEDLYSFLVLKLHQVLRRNSYDLKMSDSRFFNIVFRNFIIDIQATLNRNYISQKYDTDCLDDCIITDKFI